jgi:hypothetical protein
LVIYPPTLSAPSTIERNFKQLKTLHPFPILQWEKITGPFDVALIITDTIKIIGLKKSKPNIEKIKSKKRMIKK